MLSYASPVSTRASVRRTVAVAVSALMSWIGVAPAYAQKSCEPPTITTVLATQHWVDSGITLSGGEIVTIKASGTWAVEAGGRTTGPTGFPADCPHFICTKEGASWGALMARVTDDAHPLLFQAAGASFFNLNGHAFTDETYTGALQFQINDYQYGNITDFMADNTGRMKVTTTVCYPATLYQEGYYTGDEIRITEDMATLPHPFNFSVGSLRVAPGWKIQVFMDEHYGGATRTFTKDTVDLSIIAGTSCPGGHWASCISSVKVSPK